MLILIFIDLTVEIKFVKKICLKMKLIVQLIVNNFNAKNKSVSKILFFLKINV